MAFGYQAGNSTPDFSGLFEIPNLRIVNAADGSGNEPSFRPLIIPVLTDTCPLRFSSVGAPRGGGVSSTPQPDFYTFDVAAWFKVASIDDVQGAIDYLHDHFSVAGGWMTATLNAPGWSAVRTMTVRKGGPIQVTPRDKGDMVTPERFVQLTFIANDPLKYSAQATTTITTATPITNAGNAAATFTVRFEGPVTDHVQIDGPGGSGLDRIRLNYALAGGEYAEINTADGSIVTNTGTDLYGDIAALTVRTLTPGSNSFTASNGGSGVAKIKARSAWE